MILKMLRSFTLLILILFSINSYAVPLNVEFIAGDSSYYPLSSSPLGRYCYRSNNDTWRIVRDLTGVFQPDGEIVNTKDTVKAARKKFRKAKKNKKSKQKIQKRKKRLQQRKADLDQCSAFENPVSEDPPPANNDESDDENEDDSQQDPPPPSEELRYNFSSDTDFSISFPETGELPQYPVWQSACNNTGSPIRSYFAEFDYGVSNPDGSLPSRLFTQDPDAALAGCIKPDFISSYYDATGLGDRSFTSFLWERTIFSVYIRKGTSDNFRMKIFLRLNIDLETNQTEVFHIRYGAMWRFDENGVPSLRELENIELNEISTQDVGNGWYRVSVSREATDEEMLIPHMITFMLNPNGISGLVVPNASTYMYAPQIEVQDRAVPFSGPSQFQAVQSYGNDEDRPSPWNAEEIF